MRLIICVDARGGMSFNGRRVSRDRVVTEQIIASEGGCLRMADYSRSLFPADADLYAGEDFLENAAPEDRCFLEISDPAPWLHRAEEIILYRWNRSYPYDNRFPLEQLDSGWELAETLDFQGNSHEKITREVYRKC